MIIQLKSGAQVVIGECLWIPGAYLSGGKHWTSGAIMTPGELDQLRAELDRIAGAIAEREAANQQKRNAA
jgi:hypothetical protein